MNINLSPIMEAKKISEVPCAVNEYADKVYKLEEMISSLNSRLFSILRQEPVQEKKDNVATYSCELANSIQNNNISLNNQIGRIADILNRLEI